MQIGKRFLSVLIAVAMVITAVCGCSGKKEAVVNVLVPSVSESDESWDTVDGVAVLENNNFYFELDSATAHFSIKNKKSGDIYYSVPEYSDVSDEYISRLTSEITLEYYGEQTDKMYMYSCEAVELGNVKTLTDGNAVRVSYEFGNNSGFVPVLFDEETFEKVLESLGNDALKRRFERYYVFTSVSEKQGEYKEALQNYPILKKQNLYIIDSFASDIDKEDIVSYLQDTDFDIVAYEEMLKKLEIDDIEVEKDAGFGITVEYRLNEDGFNASILADKITENSEDYKLQKIDLLEYFSAYSSNNGAFLIPDGSGALLNFGTDKSFSNAYYGGDYTVNEESRDELNYNLALPVFGAYSEQSGVFAIIEQAAEVSELNAEPKNSSSPFNHIYSSFAFRSIDVTDYGASMQVPIYNLFSKDLIAVSPSVKYILLDKEHSSYSAMAEIYAEYLKNEATFTDSDITEAPVYIDYLCMITEKASIMGISYTKKTVLSTIEEIIASVERLKQENVGPIVVRLFGYTSDGFEHSAYNKFELEKKVGTVEELKKLSEILEADGGKLYLDADFQFSFKKGNGFNPSDDSARYLNRLVVCKGNYDIVTRKYTDTLKKYFVSPVNYTEYASDYISSLGKKWGNDNLPGLSYTSAGTYLGGDYSKKRDIDRVESAAFIEKTLSTVADKNIDMVFDSGNYYTLKYASALLNVPTRSSLYDSCDDSVPFIQMVLHGNMNYASIPQNLSTDGKSNKLDAILSGASPYICFITKDDSLLFNTPYETMWYSLSSENRLDDFIATVKDYKNVSDKIGSASFTGYSKSGDVATAVYSNGVKIYANYGSSDVTVSEIKIPAYGFAIGE